jgi:hypothetical protein
VSKRTRRFGKHSHNPTKVLRRASLDYSKTHQQFANYFEQSLNDLLQLRAHVQITKRPIGGRMLPKVTQWVIRARVPGEDCDDFEEAKRLLFDLTTALKLGQDCGKIAMVPSGQSTQVTVTTYTTTVYTISLAAELIRLPDDRGPR